MHWSHHQLFDFIIVSPRERYQASNEFCLRHIRTRQSKLSTTIRKTSRTMSGHFSHWVSKPLSRGSYCGCIRPTHCLLYHCLYFQIYFTHVWMSFAWAFTLNPSLYSTHLPIKLKKITKKIINILYGFLLNFKLFNLINLILNFLIIC